MDVRFSCYCGNSVSGYMQAFVRYVDWDNYIAVTINGSAMYLYHKVGGSLTTTINSSATSTQDVWYDVRVLMDGQDISVWRSQRDSGVEMAQVLTTSSAPVTTTARLQFVSGANASFGWDNIMVVSDDMSTTSTYAYDNANKLLTMSVAGTAQTFTYDDWERMVTKAQELNGRQATYTYRFGDKLFLVNSNFFDEAASTSFVFDGLGKRRCTGDGTIGLKWYRWGFGWDVLAEYDSDGSGTKIGTQTREYFGEAEAVGTGAGAYTWRYYVKDHLGSTRALYDANKASLGHYDYSPYGDAYLHTGADVTHLYTGHDYAPRVGLYFAPYRFYNPAAARWISRDPAGMVDGPNVYGYAWAAPHSVFDPLGDDGCDSVSAGFFRDPWFVIETLEATGAASARQLVAYNVYVQGTVRAGRRLLETANEDAALWREAAALAKTGHCVNYQDVAKLSLQAQKAIDCANRIRLQLNQWIEVGNVVADMIEDFWS